MYICEEKNDIGNSCRKETVNINVYPRETKKKKADGAISFAKQLFFFYSTSRLKKCDLWSETMVTK